MPKETYQRDLSCVKKRPSGPGISEYAVAVFVTHGQMYVKRDLSYIKRDLSYVKRDLSYVKRDLLILAYLRYAVAVFVTNSQIVLW